METPLLFQDYMRLYNTVGGDIFVKKVLLMVAVLSFVFLSCAYAETEIRFINVQWLIDEETTLQQLKESGYIRDVSLPAFSEDNSFFFIENGALGLTPTDYSKYKEVIASYSISDNSKGRIAGYPVNNIELTFAYDGMYQLISVKVDLKYADYESILGKLRKVYGEPNTSEIESEGIVLNTWEGANNTAVILYTESGSDFVLMYRRTDIEEILSQCLAAPDPDDISGL